MIQSRETYVDDGEEHKVTSDLNSEPDTKDKAKVDRFLKYRSVVQKASLNRIILVSSNFYIKPEYFSIDRDRVNFEVEPTIKDVMVIGDDGIGAANFLWRIRIKYKRRILFNLLGDYLCVYDQLSGEDEAAIKAFVRRVGLFATYPYFRAYASQVSWASDAELPTLPVLREQNILKKATATNQQD